MKKTIRRIMRLQIDIISFEKPVTVPKDCYHISLLFSKQRGAGCLYYKAGSLLLAASLFFVL